jgi:hypothetical protein
MVPNGGTGSKSRPWRIGLTKAVGLVSGNFGRNSAWFDARSSLAPRQPLYRPHPERRKAFRFAGPAVEQTGCQSLPCPDWSRWLPREGFPLVLGAGKPAQSRTLATSLGIVRACAGRFVQIERVRHIDAQPAVYGDRHSIQLQTAAT